ncbi:hypothetical protein S7711_10515 [Stachybotrys chartarum IBT 7711]|uniref:Uncharacterized protein n=1 Tax=Stachybotrys chartarum (strain CBS 109288 / IBT 7711) TaxID=1280523 RepID=A0A084AJ35_STACB|nr:hypothetical protein S7711_10515 [Stachybotrys chartarum IBT 7711]KFA47560.1 hypothetical protein S40293_10582 [Stachybotrys chartarum IBT 40293]
MRILQDFAKANSCSGSGWADVLFRNFLALVLVLGRPWAHRFFLYHATAQAPRWAWVSQALRNAPWDRLFTYCLMWAPVCWYLNAAQFNLFTHANHRSVVPIDMTTVILASIPMAFSHHFYAKRLWLSYLFLFLWQQAEELLRPVLCHFLDTYLGSSLERWHVFLCTCIFSINFWTLGSYRGIERYQAGNIENEDSFGTLRPLFFFTLLVGIYAVGSTMVAQARDVPGDQRWQALWRGFCEEAVLPILQFLRVAAHAYLDEMRKALLAEVRQRGQRQTVAWLREYLASDNATE